ncbi:hypothetical protein OGAPHI_007037 [Ogataea philodendri]|uniref:Ribonuclease P protein subunit n=1 Tax=Ogataea philodendri TaxID=1378263 RepID=A0A9P8SZI5_9ASCO|nr:uncharacterized protein OGAPHI_007037 [Ogataea philodendri]KAH3660451.1 hypothetical protein OGAPHI_007037 [Ogataea philodendri]
MDRKNTVERLLLSRSSKFCDDKQISELLDTRYSVTGSQKSYLSLKPTDGSRSTNKNTKKSLLGSIVSFRDDRKPSSRKTKNEFKSFVKDSLRYQNKLAKKLQNRLRRDPQLLRNIEDISKLKMCKDLILYEDYIEMNRLWNEYARELIGTSNHIPTITSKITSSELIGAELEVTQSSCIDNIGLKGIVLWDSQHNFVLIVPRKQNWKTDTINIEPTYTTKELIGGLKVISKERTYFKLRIKSDIDDIDFEIIGNRLMIRSTDRATRRFKNHSVNDIDI